MKEGGREDATLNSCSSVTGSLNPVCVEDKKCPRKTDQMQNMFVLEVYLGSFLNLT